MGRYREQRDVSGGGTVVAMMARGGGGGIGVGRGERGSKGEGRRGRRYGSEGFCGCGRWTCRGS